MLGQFTKAAENEFLLFTPSGRAAVLTPGSLAEYDPPGYLYHGAEISGQVIKYTTLPGTSRVSGSVHGSFIGGSAGGGCPHHRKAGGGLDAAADGGLGLHGGSLPGARLDCERAHRLLNVSWGVAAGLLGWGRLCRDNSRLR